MSEADDLRVTETHHTPIYQTRSHVDVLVVDPCIVQPGSISGFLAGVGKVAPVLAITDVGFAGEILKSCLAGGVTDFLDRCASAEDLLDAVRSVAVGQPLAQRPEVSELPVRPKKPGTFLSAREQQVLFQIARGKTHSQIGRAMGISTHTVDTYVKRIRSKFHLGNKAELTRMALLLEERGA